MTLGVLGRRLQMKIPVVAREFTMRQRRRWRPRQDSNLRPLA